MNSDYPQKSMFHTSKFRNINLTSEVKTVSFYTNWEPWLVFMTLSIVTGFYMIFTMVHYGWNQCFDTLTSPIVLFIKQN